MCLDHYSTNWLTLIISQHRCEQCFGCCLSSDTENNHQCNVVWSWASCQIRKSADAHAPGMPGTFSPRPRVSDPDMHHGTCVTHVPWCMLGSLTNGFLWSRSRGKTFPAFPAHAQPTTLPIWKEAHGNNDEFMMTSWHGRCLPCY